MIKGKNDFLLVKLGKKYGFPRGFPILWVPRTNRIVTYGFYPKFENDEILKKQRADDKVQNDIHFLSFAIRYWFGHWW